ncbi:MAG: BLUF domain-containing protein [Sphingomonadaceae bacterium]
MSLVQLIYTSHPFGFEDGILHDILTKSRANNRRDGVTGALICRADMYLQLLEGPEDKVLDTYRRITHDDRHLELSVLVSGAIAERRFPAWAMRDDPARSWMWSQAEVRDGAVQAASAQEICAVFDRVAREA